MTARGLSNMADLRRVEASSVVLVALTDSHLIDLSVSFLSPSLAFSPQF